MKEILTTKFIINGEEWYLYKQMARRLRVTPQTVYNMVNSGRVIRFDVDGTSFYRER